MAKGRSATLISRRDEALLRRYYHLTEVQRLRFDDALRLLSEQEFFLSQARVMQIIRTRASEIAEVAILPVPKVRMPRLTKAQLSMFSKEE